MSDADFANQYIDRIITEVLELTKIRLMSETRIAYLEKVNADLQVQLKELQENDGVDIFDHPGDDTL